MTSSVLLSTGCRDTIPRRGYAPLRPCLTRYSYNNRTSPCRQRQQPEKDLPSCMRLAQHDERFVRVRRKCREPAEHSHEQERASRARQSAAMFADCEEDSEG